MTTERTLQSVSLRIFHVALQKNVYEGEALSAQLHEENRLKIPFFGFTAASALRVCHADAH